MIFHSNILLLLVLVKTISIETKQSKRQIECKVQYTQKRLNKAIPHRQFSFRLRGVQP
jgi:hypothetical protein